MPQCAMPDLRKSSHNALTFDTKIGRVPLVIANFSDYRVVVLNVYKNLGGFNLVGRPFATCVKSSTKKVRF